MKDFFKMLLASCLGVILASLVAFFIFFSMLGSLVGGVMKSITGGEKTKTEVSLKQESVLLLDLTGSVSETPAVDFAEFNPFSKSERKSFVLSEVLQAIEIARENPKVEAIVLDLERASIGTAAAKDIRDALLRFKESGKRIYAFSDYYSTMNYYISSVADEVYAGPLGSLWLGGLASVNTFYKGLMQKIGVDVQVYKVGTFKGAVEPFILDRLSPENRMQIETYLNGLWDGITAEMAVARGVDQSVIQAFADEGRFMEFNQAGLELDLIDSLVHAVDRDKVMALKVNGDPETEVKTLRVSDVLRLKKGKANSDGKVAVLFAEGSIVEKHPGEENPFITDSFITNDFVDKLRELAEDDSVDAIVLRVNSGGGALTTSELIANEVEQLKQEKPIVVSMGNMAASGGYYISSHASTIVASPYTITGSIGIFGMVPNFAGTYQKLGLKNEVVKTADKADMISGIRPLNAGESAVMQRLIEQGYDLFLTRVSTGRSMTKAQVDSVGQGRVWLGQDALTLGLVDKLGGIQAAVDEAARLANLDSYRVDYKIEREDPFKSLFSMNISAVASYLKMSPAEQLLAKLYQEVEQMSGVQAMPPYSLEVMGAVEHAKLEQELLPLLTQQNE